MVTKKKTRPKKADKKAKTKAKKTPKSRKPTGPNADIDALVKKSSEECGGGYIVYAEEANCSYLLRRPSGIFSLDLASAGGFPAGSMAEIAGAEGMGKNYLANQYIRMCQQIYGDEARIFVAVSEYKYDKPFARKFGVRVAFSKEEIAEMERASGTVYLPSDKKELMEQIGRIVLIQEMTAEYTLQTVLDFLRSGAFHMGVLDSIGAMAPKAEVDKHLKNKAQMAAKAALQQRFMDQFYNCIGGTKTFFLALNQVRAPIGEYVPRGGILPLQKYKVPEAYAVKHGLVGRLILSYGGDVREASPEEADGESAADRKKWKRGKVKGKVIKWEITKGKQGFHEGASGEWVYHYQHGIDLFLDFINVAITCAERAGSYYRFMDMQFQGRAEFEQFFRDNPDKIEEAKAFIYKQKEVTYLWT